MVPCSRSILTHNGVSNLILCPVDVGTFMSSKRYMLQTVLPKQKPIHLLTKMLMPHN